MSIGLTKMRTGCKIPPRTEEHICKISEIKDDIDIIRKRMNL
jgi:hypothetical protein